MRLFIAIRFNEEMKRALADAQMQMKRCGVRGNYTSIDNLHLTAAFIGEYPDPLRVMEAMETVAFTPFELSVQGFGNFGDLWWIGIHDSPVLQAVVRRIRRALSDYQIPFDRKSFRPHITLVRKAKMTQGMPAIDLKKAQMLVDTLSLMRSDRGRNGMIYTEIGTIAADEPE